MQERPSGLFVARDTLLGDLVADEARRAGADPYAFDEGLWLSDFRLEARLGMAVTDPRAQIRPLPITWTADWPMPAEDPGLRWARGWREFGRQLVDIVRFEVAEERRRARKHTAQS